MGFAVIISIFLVAAICTTYLYKRTNFIKFLIEKLKINSKLKCTILDIVALLLVVYSVSGIYASYRNIFSDILLFIGVLISILLNYIGIELKAYKK